MYIGIQHDRFHLSFFFVTQIYSIDSNIIPIYKSIEFPHKKDNTYLLTIPPDYITLCTIYFLMRKKSIYCSRNWD